MGNNLSKGVDIENNHLQTDKQLNLSKCDVIKVLMMLTVMFYHCICLWSRSGWFNQAPSQPSAILAYLCGWFNSFHIYVFAFVSGYLFFYLKYEKGKYKSIKTYISNRGIRLLVPYIATAIIWVIPFYVFYYDTNTMDIINRFALATSPNQLWFLVMLFGVSCMFYICSDLLYKKNFLFGIVLVLIFYGIGTIGGILLPNIFQIWTVCKYMLFYYMGFVFRKYKNNVFYRIPWIVYFVVDIMVFAFYFYFTTMQEGVIFKLLNIVLNPICNILGTLMVVIGISKFKYEKIQNTKIYIFLVKHNFVMYLFHQQLIYISISLLNYKVSTPLMVLVNFMFSFLVSALIAIVLSKIPKDKNNFGYK